MARVMSGVTFDTSNYLTLHPDVNDFFTSLKGQPRDQIRDQVQSYLDANPQVQDELRAIRQPSVDFRERCGASGDPLTVSAVWFVAQGRSVAAPLRLELPVRQQISPDRSVCASRVGADRLPVASVGSSLSFASRTEA